MKKVAAIHDMSGFGRSSLTNIIPTLSTMGIQVCPVPTAILSTHSGGYDDYTFHDLTDIMLDYTAHWKKLKLSFDCIYSGFLGSPRQIDIVTHIIDDFRTEDNLVVVDPVMGDNGELYNSIPKDMIPQMRKLITKSDIIVPNFTEAKLLLGKKDKAFYSREEVKEWMLTLSDMGPKTVIVTSVPDVSSKDVLNVVSYEKESGVFWKVPTKHLPCDYPGTGDIFASVMIGALLHGENLPVSMDKAVQFVAQCIQASRGYEYPNRYGVLLEKELPLLRDATLIGGYEEF